MSLGLRRKLVRTPPEGIAANSYYLHLAGPLLFALSLSLQLTVTAFLLFGVSHDRSFENQVTVLGRLWVRPERDMALYVGGIIFSMVAAVGSAFWWRSRIVRFAKQAGEGTGRDAAKSAAPGNQEFLTRGAAAMFSAALLLGCLAGLSMGAFLLLLSSHFASHEFGPIYSSVREPLPTFDGLRLLVPAVLAVGCAVVELRSKKAGGILRPAPNGTAQQYPERRVRARGLQDLVGRVPSRGADRLLCWGIPAVIILVIAVPRGAAAWLAGRMLETDNLHHLNFFFMAPALSFAHGKAFGTEIFSQYGIGWPLVASFLARISALTYANLVCVEITYGCIYFIGLFFLLRSVFQNSVWAAIGVVLAVYWQIFTGMHRTGVPWTAPSLTLMRHSMDVWFFWALFKYQSQRRFLWLELSGVAIGLGIFFETETGLYLMAAFFLYSLLLAGQPVAQVSNLLYRRLPIGRPSDQKRAPGSQAGSTAIQQIGNLRYDEGSAKNAKGRADEGVRAPGESQPIRSAALVFVVGCAFAALTLLPLLAYASRGALLTRAFWRGWTEPLFLFGSWGVSAMPIAELPDVPLLSFICIVAVFLSVVIWAATRALHCAVTDGEALLAVVAAYGLACLLLFVNRSHPFYMWRVLVPFAAVATALLFQAAKFARTGASALLSGNPWPSPLLSFVLIGVVVLLLTKPEFRRYPSLASALFRRVNEPGLSLMSEPVDVAGLPDERGGFVQEFREVASAVRAIAPGGRDVAILDAFDTPIYCAAHAEPWSRNTPLFDMALTKSFIEEIGQKLMESPPRYVVVLGQKRLAHRDLAADQAWDFIRSPLYWVVTNRFRLRHTVASYEIWEKSDWPLASSEQQFYSMRLRQLIDLQSYVMDHCIVADALARRGETANAIAEYQKALKLNPDLPAALNNMAWIRSASAQPQYRDGAEAVKLAERACELTHYKEAAYIGTLGVAYAEAGRFDEAVAMAEKARESAQAAGDKQRAAKNQELMELFKAHRPYRDQPQMSEGN
ncbi:MAG: hypothetical protein C5B50_17895 [Verrucomicrobia bacterium]|nr:MAG: hypothetical protein C5B50_17895 [Verrucomicrobiota bacterium]